MSCTARECSHIKIRVGPHCTVQACPNFVKRCKDHKHLMNNIRIHGIAY